MSLNLKKETILKLNANLKEVVGGQKPSRKIWNEEMTTSDECRASTTMNNKDYDETRI